MPVSVRDAIAVVDRLAPPAWALPEDSVGLQAGRPDAPLCALLVALEVTPAALDLAAECGAELLVTHHPLLYQPLAQVRTDAPVGALVARLLAGGHSLYVAHTNLDAAPGLGLAALWAQRLGLREPQPLLPGPDEDRLKLVTFCPPPDAPALRRALAAAGAGTIGDYTECAFQVTGEGHFRAPQHAHPAVGEAGAENRVPEARLEMVLPAAAQGAVVRALYAAHPYETPAFDLYPLRAVPGEVGMGRLGDLPEEVSAARLAQLTAQIAAGGPVTLLGDRPVRRVAVLPGTGRSGVQAAVAQGAQGFLTGELDYHSARAAAQQGLTVVAAGHGNTEAIVLEPLAQALRDALGETVSVTVAPVEPLWRVAEGAGQEG